MSAVESDYEYTPTVTKSVESQTTTIVLIVVISLIIIIVLLAALVVKGKKTKTKPA